jgi:hypothetical protein
VGAPAPDLEELVRAELLQPAPAAATQLTDEILRRHGSAVAAVLFYGSCLRRRTSEGVLDFYVLVDTYRDAYRSRLLAWANAALPPNVFYLEIESELGPLRCKYAVVSLTDFERGAKPGGLRSGIWARFCQPALAVHLRDATAREAVVAAVVESTVTAVARTLYELPTKALYELPTKSGSSREIGPTHENGPTQENGSTRFTTAALWQQVLRGTYSAELRPEAPATIRSLYEADPERYDRAARGVLARMGAEVRVEGAEIEAILPTDSKAWTRRGWSRLRVLAKLVYFVQLIKSAATFGDWLPYVLWKLERHTGKKIVPSERQRRYPYLFGWPLLLRILWQRDLR